MVLNEKIASLSIVAFAKSIFTIRQDWRIKTPYQKWCYLYNIGKTAFKINTIPLYENDQKLNWYSYFSYFYIGMYAFIVLYTAFFYIIHGEFVKCFPCTGFIATLIAVSFVFIL